MDDLISREDVFESLRKLSGVGGIYLWDPEEVMAVIEKAPAVDAVPVVRCEDCTFWKRHTKVDKYYGACSLYRITKHENGFCDRGERREP